MPDMPSGQPAASGQEPDADESGAGGGGGIVDAIQQSDAMVLQITQAIQQNPKLPDEVKQAWGDAQGALRKAQEALMQAVGGGGDSGGAPAGGTTTPEQGASGAVPMSMAGGK